MKQRAILILFIVLLLTFFGYKYLTKEHRNIAGEKAVVTIESSNIYLSIKDNEEAFNSEYLDKTIQVQGMITNVNDKSVILDDKCYILFKDSIINFDSNDRVTIKGRYVGYDDLLDQVKIDQAIIIQD